MTSWTGKNWIKDFHFEQNSTMQWGLELNQTCQSVDVNVAINLVQSCRSGKTWYSITALGRTHKVDFSSFVAFAFGCNKLWDSIAVSVFLILVELDKYKYQKQIQISTDGKTSRLVYNISLIPYFWGPDLIRTATSRSNWVRLMVTTYFGRVLGLFWPAGGPKMGSFGPICPIWMVLHSMWWYCTVNHVIAWYFILSRKLHGILRCCMVRKLPRVHLVIFACSLVLVCSLVSLYWVVSIS